MYYSPNTIVYDNGNFTKSNEVTLDPYSKTLHYGIGAFEGIRSYDSLGGVVIFKAFEHFDRLRRSAEKMDIPFEYSNEELFSICSTLLKRNRLSNAYIRPLIYLGPDMSFRNLPESRLFISAWQWGRLLGDQHINVGISSFERPNPKSCHIDAKITGHYTLTSLATTQVKKRGFDEALLLDQTGAVSQGASGNFFYEKNEVLYTSPPGHIFPGITRSSVIGLARKNGIAVIEKPIQAQELKDADAAFFTGTAVEYSPIARIEEYKMKKDWDDTVGHYLFSRYGSMVRDFDHNATVI